MRARLTCLLFLLSLSTTLQATVTATLDRQQGAVGAPLLLTLEATQSSTPSPDLTPLEGAFAILGSRHSALSSFKNGRNLVTQRWLITLSPRQPGLLEVPALSVGSERSQPLTFEALGATPAAAAKTLLALESHLDLPIAYQRSAITLSVRLFYTQRLQRAEITEPLIAGVMVYPLGEQRYFKEQRAGQTVNVIEQRYTLLAEQAGRFQIPALQFTGQDSEGKALSTRSRPLEFEALPWPQAAQGATLAATELSINARWNPQPNTPKAGDSLDYTLIIEAHNAPANWLPTPSLNWPTGISVYPQPEQRDERIDNGVLVSRLQLPFKLLLTASGNLLLPPVSISWWDTVREQTDTSTLASSTLQVANFLSDNTAAAPSEPQAAVAADTRPATASPAPQAGNSWMGWVWALVAIICAAGWTLTRYRARQLEQQLQTVQAELEQRDRALQQVDRQLQQEQQAFTQLQQRCRHGEPEQVYQALLDWARHFWPERTFSTLQDVEEAANAPTLTYLLRNLEHRLRHRDEEDPWMGDLALEQLARLRRKRG